MKQYILLFMISFFANFSQAQSIPYDKLWKKVDTYENNGSTKSALEVVEQISSIAFSQNNTSQQIKSLLYKSKYTLILEEDAQLKIINDFKSQIAKSNTPTTNILENMLANLYWQYFQQNRHRFYNRTHIENDGDGHDFRTWDLQSIFNEVDVLYQKSLKNSASLAKTPLSDYDSLLHTQEDSKLYRPTLYDFLSQNALDFYQTDENSITQPAYKFSIDNPKYFSDAKSFSTLTIIHRDSGSLQLKALKIYKDLITYHLNDKEPYALVSVDIQRLQFIKNNATFPGKNALFLNTLKEASDHYKNTSVSALYDFERALYHYEQGKTFDPNTNVTPRWMLKEAIAVCDDISQRFPNSKTAAKCTVLKQIVSKPSLQLTTETHIPIQQNSHVLVQYANLSMLNFRAYKMSDSELEKFNTTYRQEERFALIKQLKATEAWKIDLKDEKDYQPHTTEIVVPKLDNGQYLIVASPDFSNGELFGFKTIQVTNMALANKTQDDKTTYQVISRKNGAPISGVKVSLNYREYTDKSEQNQTFVTDRKGEFQLKNLPNRYYNLNMTLVNKGEIAHFKDHHSRPNYTDADNEKPIVYKPFLFTDRSIYRPGQVVYFKGIATKMENKKTSVYANQSATVALKNVNGEVVKELQLKTNGYGSVSGKFILPNNGLTGSFRIEMFAGSSGDTHISVEDYKRPKFEPKFLPITETYQINDSVTVKGTALAYAGSTITDAKIVYRVHRKVQFPRWFYWYQPWFYSEPQEIAHGTSTTDKDGNFEITFNAIPDVSVDKSNLPIFNYEITADVTDLNGETRSTTTIVNVGYHALLAHLSIDPQMNKAKSDHQLKVTTTNLNGAFVPATGNLKIYKLIAPSAVLRTRPWQAPDYQTLSREAFKKLFPHESYQEEHKPETWKKGEMVFESDFDTSKSTEISLGDLKKWKSGNYTVVLESADKFGHSVKDEAQILIYSPDDKKLPDQQLFHVSTDKNSYHPGKNVIITFGSAAEDVVVTVDIEKDQKIIHTYIVPLNNNKKSLSIPVLEQDLGGFAVHYSFAAFNSFYAGTETIAIPYPKSDLTIETTTFRDKLEPGTNETWSFSIKGPKGDEVSAELLASMYDMSLDQFQPHQWHFNPLYHPVYYSHTSRRAYNSFGIDAFNVYFPIDNLSFPEQNYDQWNWFGFHFGHRRYGIMIRGQASGVHLENSMANATESEADLQENITVSDGTQKKSQTTGAIGLPSEQESLDPFEEPQPQEDITNISIRKNLQETAFFFPQLQTDAAGNVTFSFTTPEALTQWKLQLLAHTKTMESTTTTLETVTQKELMVVPNVPRFLRQGDAISISSKIVNLTDQLLDGEATLQLFDAISGKAINDQLGNTNHKKTFMVDAKKNTQITWTLNIPAGVDAVQYKITAKSENFSDGEQNLLPVLSNRILVTETLPMWIGSNESKTFVMDKFASSANASKTLKNHKLTLEITSNPAWYAVQALPSLMESPYDSNEQIFSRYYANALAGHIANSHPRIKEVFDQWKNSDALLSHLEKNEELKNILIAETPWLRDAESETEQRKRIALLFDKNNVAYELEVELQKLQNNQMSNGAWPWFEGGRHNRFITQQIVAGFGHLEKLGVSHITTKGTSEMISKAIAYLDAEFIQEYKDIRKHNKNVDLSKDHLSAIQLHYLYMRSFFPEIVKNKEIQTITKYYLSQIQTYWLGQPLYTKGLMALITHRTQDASTSVKILNSLKENSITSDELGMYWKNNTTSWHWYQAPIETQALMIEAFSEIQKDTTTVDNLKIWLLKSKQTSSWNTTKATTEAVYALLLQGSDWLSGTERVDVVIGNETISSLNSNNDPGEAVKVEAGTGYYKTSWNSSEIKPEMAKVTMTKKDNGIAWANLYWQYFEDLDKVSFADTPLNLTKKLFLKTNTDIGEKLTEIMHDTELEVGDLVRVRIQLRSDRDMEFIHMKDMRAAGFEPVNVLSSYKYQDGLGYYESTKDAATNFFFDFLPKGVYVFEYDLRVNNSGDMSNGITIIQNMYAPEFSSHSEGIRVKVN